MQDCESATRLKKPVVAFVLSLPSVGSYNGIGPLMEEGSKICKEG